MTVTGVSGEDYVLRCVEKEDFDTKVTISSMKQAVKDVEILTENLTTKQSERAALNEKTIEPTKNIQSGNVKSALPLTSLAAKPANGPDQDKAPGSDLPAVLNAKITLKGNNLPLKIYLSTISQVTGYNVITTPQIDSQKTSINLENIEVWRALKESCFINLATDSRSLRRI